MSKISKFFYPLKVIIVRLFFPRLCYACHCTDCQLKAYNREYWYCPHLNNSICNICCVYDSMDPHWNWIECKTCEHDKDRDKTELYS